MNIKKSLIVPALLVGAVGVGSASSAILASADTSTATDASTTTTATTAAASTSATTTAASTSSNAADSTADQNHGPHTANGKTETPLTGDNLAKATAAVNAAQPGATIERVETDADGVGVYEAHITKADGTRATVYMDASFKVTSTEAGMGPGGHAKDTTSSSTSTN